MSSSYEMFAANDAGHRDALIMTVKPSKTQDRKVVEIERFDDQKVF